MRTRIGLAVAVLGMGLAACSTLEQAVPPAPKTPQQTVYEIKAGLVTAEDAGLAWAAQICPTAGSCQDGRVGVVMRAMVSADSLVAAAERAVRANAATTSATSQAINDATAALTALQAILTQYGVVKGS